MGVGEECVCARARVYVCVFVGVGRGEGSLKHVTYNLGGSGRSKKK